jgi:hypothetical protein
MAEPLYTDADVELARQALWTTLQDVGSFPLAVLDALTAAGWRPHAIESTIEQANQTRANTRATVAEEIAQALEARRPHIPPPMATDRRQRLVQRSTLNEAARVAREIGGRDASA